MLVTFAWMVLGCVGVAVLGVYVSAILAVVAFLVVLVGTLLLQEYYL